MIFSTSAEVLHGTVAVGAGNVIVQRLRVNFMHPVIRAHQTNEVPVRAIPEVELVPRQFHGPIRDQVLRALLGRALLGLALLARALLAHAPEVLVR